MKYLKLFIKLLFVPIRVLNNIVYGGPPINVAYSWYTQENYLKMVEHANDDESNLIQSYEDWKKNADQRIEDMKNLDMRVFRVNVDYEEMSIWLSGNGLGNTVENREKYINHKFQKFMNDPIIK